LENIRNTSIYAKQLGAYMAVNLSPIGGAGWQFFDNNGVPLSAVVTVF